MSVAHLGSRLTAELHQKYLKARGFRKHGATFVREKENYLELYNVQGSPWNSGTEPWQFYLNVGARFADLAPIQGAKLTPAYAHAEGRSDSILPGTPPTFELTERSISEVAAQLEQIISAVSEALPSIIPAARTRAALGFYSPLPVPKSWSH